MQAGLFHGRKDVLHQPTGQHSEWQVWSAGRKRDVSPSWLLIERAKFAQQVMVSAGVCLQGKGYLHFVQEKSKTNADYSVNELLLKLMDNCHHFARPTFHISSRWSTCACSKTDRTMACSSLSFIDKDACSKQPRLKFTWLPCLELDAGQIQPFESTTAEYPGAEDSASDDMGWAAARSYHKINRQLPQASVRLHQCKRRTLWI